MRTLTADIFSIPWTPEDAVCVTTNGKIRKDGRAVMGRGIALTADRRFDLAVKLAEYLRAHGNRAFNLGVRTDKLSGRPVRVLTCPTKHDWHDRSDLTLIRRSCEQLVAICDKFGVRTCYLPRPGCANGGLDWETQVRPVVEPILDDRFVVVDLPR